MYFSRIAAPCFLNTNPFQWHQDTQSPKSDKLPLALTPATSLAMGHTSLLGHIPVVQRPLIRNPLSKISLPEKGARVLAQIACVWNPKLKTFIVLSLI